MSEYLELPDLEGSVVSKGDAFPEDHVRPERTAKPLSPEKKLPVKSNLQKVVEVADDDVVAAREEKERKQREKNVVPKRKVADNPKGASKRRRKVLEEEVVSSGDNTLDVTPLNQAEPQADVEAGRKDPPIPKEQNTPHAEEGPKDDLAEGAGHNDEENLEGFSKPPSPDGSAHTAHSERHASRSPEPSRTSPPLEPGIIIQAELLQRFSQLNRDFRELTEVHKGCADLSGKQKEVEEERDVKARNFDKLLKEFHALEDEVSAASTRQEGLVEQLEEMERDKNEWRSTASSQAARIKELEGQLSNKSSECSQLQEQNKQLTARVAQSEVVRHNAVKELLPAVCRRLFQSREYKKSMGKVYSLSYTAGFVDGVKADFKDGVKVARDEEDVERILEQVKNLNREAPSLWKDEFNKIFDSEYPYVKKVAESYRLPLGDLMNLLPEGSVVPEKIAPATGPSEPKNN